MKLRILLCLVICFVCVGCRFSLFGHEQDEYKDAFDQSYYDDPFYWYNEYYWDIKAEKGDDVKQDDKEAIKCYRKTAEQRRVKLRKN